MNARAALCVLAILCCACTPQPAQAPLPPSQAEVEAFINQYADATRAGDAVKLMSMFSREPGVSSAGAGMIFSGWDTIKTVTDETIDDARQIPITLGVIDVTPLGADTALAVFPFKLGNALGAGTIILKRTPEGLRIIHEHYSLRDA